MYSCLENPMDRGAWKAAVHAVAKSWTWLSDLTFTFHFHALEKEMATHSSVLAWRIPGTGEPGGLPSVGLHRVGHDWSDLAAAAAYIGRYLQMHKFWLLMNYSIKMYVEVTLKVQCMLKDNMWQPYAVSGDERRTSFCYTCINSNHIL